jgi:hypothetical protein
LAPDRSQLDEAVDRTQQVTGRDVLFQVEAAEQHFLPHRPLAHHGRVLRR